jgi:uncharacterized protein (TIGR02453 family)
MASTRYFTPALFRFLMELRDHNEREWFLKNKTRYETEVRDPFLRLIADLSPRLKKLSPYFVVDPRPVGGSMMRIYRDIRFSKDKSPYKTSMSAHFWHAKGKDGASPAFYLHIEPDGSAVGGGVWRPPADVLKMIRKAIATKSEAWAKVVSVRSFRSSCGMVGESLKRAPPGFDEGQPFIDDIKRKDFATSSRLDDGEVLGPDLLRSVSDGFEAMAPFMRFITGAMGLRF